MSRKSIPALADLVEAGRRIEHHAPWPRALVTPKAWSLAVEQLAAGRWSLLGLWGEPDRVHMALLDE
ncbi:hydrogenase expression protein HypE, partial [Mesorhizobium sp. M8A.F.Ca.ET.202.01.1.1]